MKKNETYTKIHGQADQLSKDIYNAIKSGKSYGKYMAEKRDRDNDYRRNGNKALAE